MNTLLSEQVGQTVGHTEYRSDAQNYAWQVYGTDALGLEEVLHEAIADDVEVRLNRPGKLRTI